jgi:F1F0 ATPase subunit 2
MSAIVTILACFIGGVVLAATYVATLRRNVELYSNGQIARARVAHLLRLAVVGAIFWLLARWGAGPLLSAFAGFVIARVYLVRRASGRKPS